MHRGDLLSVAELAEESKILEKGARRPRHRLNFEHALVRHDFHVRRAIKDVDARVLLNELQLHLPLEFLGEYFARHISGHIFRHILG